MGNLSLNNVIEVSLVMFHLDIHMGLKNTCDVCRCSQHLQDIYQDTALSYIWLRLRSPLWRIMQAKIWKKQSSLIVKNVIQTVSENSTRPDMKKDMESSKGF